MRAVVFHGIGDIRLDKVPDPHMVEPSDAIVRLTASAICGTDLHFVRGTVPGMKPGTVLGHEGVGVVVEVGSDVKNLTPGDRVVVASTIACGVCSYCRAGYYAQCDRANPRGARAGTCFFGGPEASGPIDGLQAELARIPFASMGLVKLPDEVTDDEAILLSDVFPTGYFGAELAEIVDGDTVAVFGCGPVGQLAILSARLLGAGRVFAVDSIPSRLEAARGLGAEIIDFATEDPVEAIVRLTGGIGADRAIDAVGVDATTASGGPAAARARDLADRFRGEMADVAPETNPVDDNWHPGGAPSQALCWAVDALAKAGSLGIVGVYPESMRAFPLGKAMSKNLTVNLGNCNHRRYIPRLLGRMISGEVDLSRLLTHATPLASAIEAYRAFDRREHGWTKVELRTAA